MWATFNQPKISTQKTKKVNNTQPTKNHNTENEKCEQHSTNQTSLCCDFWLVECCSPFQLSVLWFLVGWVLFTFLVFCVVILHSTNQKLQHRKLKRWATLNQQKITTQQTKKLSNTQPTKDHNTENKKVSNTQPTKNHNTEN
jgi:hypothetical protein